MFVIALFHYSNQKKGTSIIICSSSGGGEIPVSISEKKQEKKDAPLKESVIILSGGFPVKPCR
jgi:hypothetical protein